MSASDLAHTLSAAFGAPLVDLDAIDPQDLPRHILDPRICQDYRVVVLARRANRLSVATADPSDQQAAEKIKFATQMGVDWIIAEYDKLTRMVEANATTAAEAMDNIIGDDFQFDESTMDAGVATEDDKAATAEVEDAPVVKFLHKMLLDAISARASDIHFEPYEHNYRVRFRIDGELREMAAPPVAIKDKLASRIKVISRMDIAEKRVPQDGRMKLKIGPEKVIDFRVSTLPTLFGEKIVIRILDPSSAKLGIEALGYEKAEKDRLMNAIGRPYGMILVTGPTGSGKTTTLYAAISETDDEREARRLAEWVSGRGGRVTARELHRGAPTRYRDTESARLALDALAAVGLGHWVEITGGRGRPTLAFELTVERLTASATDDGEE